MITSWVLIIVMYVSAGVTSQQVRYTNKQSCEKAVEELRKFPGDIRAICISSDRTN